MKKQTEIDDTIQQLGDISGNRILITGATDGIGKACAKLLASAGAHITIVARSEKKAKKVLSQLSPAADKHDVVIADLGSIQSCQHAVRVLSSKKPYTHVLANAGISGWGTDISQQQNMFHVNHTGHFVLITGLVSFGKLNNARVVLQSSIAHWQARNPTTYSEYFDDRRQVISSAYSDSKMANLMFANYLPTWATSQGVKLISRTAHPGFAVTNINNIILRDTLPTLVWKTVTGDPKLMALFVANKMGLSQKTTEDAALPMIHAAFGLTEGRYLGPKEWFGLKGYPVSANSHRWAKCHDRTYKLWLLTCQYCQRQCPEIDWLEAVSRES